MAHETASVEHTELSLRISTLWQNIFPFCRFPRQTDQTHFKSHKPQCVKGIAPAWQVRLRPWPAGKVNVVSGTRRRGGFFSPLSAVSRRISPKSNVLQFNKLGEVARTSLSLHSLRGLDCFEAVKETFD